MIKGSDVRTADHPIDTLFLDRGRRGRCRESRSTSGELLTLFEAARWAPSSGNSQPWRFLYARRETEHWPLFFDLLVDGNKVWCHSGAALVVFISKSTNDRTGKPLVTHSYDTGAAWVSLALQGWLKGLVVHGMAGFDYARAKEVLHVPDDFRVEAMACIGKPGPPRTCRSRMRSAKPEPASAAGREPLRGPFRSPG